MISPCEAAGCRRPAARAAATPPRRRPPHPTTIGSTRVVCAVISAISTTPVTGARTTAAKNDDIPTTANAVVGAADAGQHRVERHRQERAAGGAQHEQRREQPAWGGHGVRQRAQHPAHEHDDHEGAGRRGPHQDRLVQRVTAPDQPGAARPTSTTTTATAAALTSGGDAAHPVGRLEEQHDDPVVGDTEGAEQQAQRGVHREHPGRARARPRPTGQHRPHHR